MKKATKTKTKKTIPLQNHHSNICAQETRKLITLKILFAMNNITFLTTPSKTPPPLSCQEPPPPFILQTVQAPLFSQSPPLYWFFMTSIVKIGFFCEPQKYQSFSFLTLSYLLKVTRFLVKTSQFEFLVMIEKNFYQLFLSLNISDFGLFFL